MDEDLKRGYATGALLTGAGTGAALTPTALNRSKGALVRRSMKRSIGNLGGLDAAGKPVNPFGLSSRHGKDDAGRRPPSQRVETAERYRHAAKPFKAKLARPAIGGGKAKALQIGGAIVGATGVGEFVGTGLEHGIRNTAEREKVRKDSTFQLDSPQFGLGIPATRMNPISPLAMSASSSIMANFLVGASGKKLKRKEKKALRRGAYQFAGANGMLYSPLGFGRTSA